MKAVIPSHGRNEACVGRRSLRRPRRQVSHCPGTRVRCWHACSSPRTKSIVTIIGVSVIAVIVRGIVGGVVTRGNALLMRLRGIMVLGESLMASLNVVDAVGVRITAFSGSTKGLLVMITLVPRCLIGAVVFPLNK